MSRRKIELMTVEGKMLLRATPPTVSLGNAVHFQGEFRRGISPVSGARVLIYRVGWPDELVGHATVERDGDFYDFWVSNKLGVQRFYALCPSPSAQSPTVEVRVSSPTRESAYTLPRLGAIVDRLLAF